MESVALRLRVGAADSGKDGELSRSLPKRGCHEVAHTFISIRQGGKRTDRFNSGKCMGAGRSRTTSGYRSSGCVSSGHRAASGESW